MQELGRIVSIIVVVVIAILLLVAGGNIIIGLVSSPSDEESQKPTVVLTNYANANSSVSFEIDGPIVGDEQHNAVRMTVSADERTLQIYEGYDGTVIDEQRFSNTLDAYRAFLSALAFEGFTAEKKTNLDSVAGVCPDARRYISQVRANDQLIQELWTGSCRRGEGTLAADNTEIRDLFIEQIPQYKERTKDLNL